MKVFLDDCRDGPTGWITIRTADTLLSFMESNQGAITELSLDYDLSHAGDNGEDGLWFVKMMVGCNLYADKIYIHSADPYGRRIMYRHLAHSQYMKLIPDHVRIYQHMLPEGYMEVDDSE